MTSQLSFGSLFSGVGGFDLGLERASWKCKWQVENNDFCTKILKRHWPNVPKFGDITTVEFSGLERIDMVCGGFPCQDVSVAGNRAGLAGERSQLFWDAIRCVRVLEPGWVLIENVPGLFSSNDGRDFALVVSALDELGYGVAWRVLDSRNFGVAQKRRRVFIVGCLGKPCPPEILFDSKVEAIPPSTWIPRLFQSGTLEARSPFQVSAADTLIEIDSRDDSFGIREATGISGWMDTPDTPRYRALGNAVTVPVAEWIGRRIANYDLAQ